MKNSSTSSPSTGKIIVAVDGLAASGKGTLARSLAQRFDFSYLDTGKLYRLVGLYILRAGKNPTIEAEACERAEKMVENFDVRWLDDPELKSDRAGNAASQSAVHPGVRAALLDLQRHFPDRSDQRGAILDGRDIGTVIFPEADLKLFVTARLDVRSQRRFEELCAAKKRNGKSESKNKNQSVDIEEDEIRYEDVYALMESRDERDTKRMAAPTLVAEDAITIDTSDMEIKDVLDLAASYLKRVIEAH